MTYDTVTKDNRMQGVIDAIDAGAGAGKLKLGSSGLSVVNATVTLNDPCGTKASGVLTFSGFPKSDSSAAAAGKIVEGGLTDSDDNVRKSGLTVGLTSTAAPNWAATTAYAVDAKVTNGDHQYKCTSAGTSAGSGGPTGTGTGITDNGATWDYYSPANADIQLDNLEVNLGQTVTISSATITHAA